MCHQITFICVSIKFNYFRFKDIWVRKLRFFSYKAFRKPLLFIGPEFKFDVNSCFLLTEAFPISILIASTTHTGSVILYLLFPYRLHLKLGSNLYYLKGVSRRWHFDFWNWSYILFSAVTVLDRCMPLVFQAWN